MPICDLFTDSHSYLEKMAWREGLHLKEGDVDYSGLAQNQAVSAPTRT
jgi:hypothetical protein